ncbi:HAD family hydrolase [Bacillus fonticola]|uniref:HAD family hydrolase n=1 Tax=Bacillus fonticola TaxID=2728853 RepID=UPI00147606AD|nr:HAD family hydrolase [Bacillus fonticola]
MIFFDIDATLLDHEYAENKGALDYFYQRTDSFDLTDEEFINKWNDLSKKHFQRFLDGHLSFQEQRQVRIKELYGTDLTNAQADREFDYYLQLYKENWKAFDDVISCLDLLLDKKYKLGIISNGDYEQQIEKLDKIGITQYFSYIFTSSKLGVAKPDSNIFLEACYQANCNVSESYYVGDNLEIDTVGSLNAGMKGIWLNRKNEPFSHSGTTIHSLKELGALF